MEHDTFRRLVFGGLGGILGVGIIVVASYIVWHRSLSPRIPLESYAPTSARMVLKVDRDALFEAESLIDHISPVFKKEYDALVTYWVLLENRLDVHIEQAVFIESQDRGIPWQSVIVSVRDRITSRQAARRSSATYPHMGWLDRDGTMLVKSIDDHTFALVMPEDTQDYTVIRQDSSYRDMITGIALRMNVGFLRDAALALGVDNTIIGTGAKKVSDSDSVMVSLTDGIIRIIVPGSASDVSRPALDIVLPEGLDAVATGGMDTLIDPIAGIMEGYVQTLAGQFSFDPDDFMREVHASRAFIAGTQGWLIATEKTESVARLASLMLGATYPRRTVGVLPDGTPYREIVRGLPLPTIEMLNDVPVSVWSEHSGGSQKTSLQNGKTRLYAVERGGIWYVSPVEDLVRDYLISPPAGTLAQSTRIASCLAPYIGDNPVILSVAITQWNKEIEFMHVVFRAKNGLIVHIACLE